jgi:hypothetical protein
MAYTPGSTPTPEELAFIVGFLRNAGHYAGPDVTEWTPEVREALIRYQIDRGIGTSGRLDQATRGEISSEIISYAGPSLGANPQTQIDLRVIATYGPGAAAYLSDPEMGAILRQAVADPDGPWDDARLMGALQETTYFKRTSQNARAWDDLNLNDPEEANRRRRQAQATIFDQTQRLGMNLPTSLVQEIAEDFLREGWNQDQLIDVVTGFIEYDPDRPEGGGSVASDVARLKSMAAQYHLTLGDEEAHSMATRIARGEATLEGITAGFRQRAKARYAYGGLPELIDAGFTPADYFADHQATIARLLEIPADKINFLDPRWDEIASYVDDAGNRRPRTLTETATWARAQEEYQTTDQAHDRVEQLALTIGRAFGATG